MAGIHVLVTGATGFIGRPFVQQLLHQNHKVTILVREAYKNEKPLPPPLDSIQSRLGIVYTDLRDYDSTSRAIHQTRPTHVVHLAAAGVTSPFLPVETALKHNLFATLHLIQACFEARSIIAKPVQVVVGRTPGERTAMNVYAASKAAAWQFCRMYARTKGWPIQGAMIFQAYGPCQAPKNLIPSAIQAACTGQDFPMTDGRQARDWIYLDDIVEGLITALGKPLPAGTTFELGTGKATTVAGVVEKIYQLTGSKGRPQIGAIPNRPGEDPYQIADVETTRALIGWQAQITLEEGLARLLAL